MHCSRLPPPTSRPPACALLRWQQKTLGSSVWNALQDSATPRGRGPEAQAAAMVEWGVWGCPRCEARPGSGWGSAAGHAQGLGRRSLQTGGRGDPRGDLYNSSGVGNSPSPGRWGARLRPLGCPPWPSAPGWPWPPPTTTPSTSGPRWTPAGLFCPAGGWWGQKLAPPGDQRAPRRRRLECKV